MRTTTRVLVDALGKHLAAANIARYNADGRYTGSASKPAVFMGAMPNEPLNAITIRVYDEVLDRDDVTTDWYVQIRCRSDGNDPRLCEDTAEAIFDLLHDKSTYALPNGVQVLLSRRKIRGLAEPDGNRRYSRPDSYRFTLNPRDV